MAGRRRRGAPIDLVAWVLLVAGMIVALSVLSNESPGNSATVPSSSNLLGSPGAWLAETLHESLGVADMLFLASWFVLVLALFQRKGMLTWFRRVAGWLLLLPSSTVLADYLGPTLIGGPAHGSGGTLGAGLRQFLLDNLSTTASVAFVLGCTSLGLLLALDVVLGHAWRAAATVARCLASVFKVVSRPQPAPPAPRKGSKSAAPLRLYPPAKESEPEGPAEEDDGLIIPIRHPETASGESDPIAPAQAEEPNILTINRPEPLPLEDNNRFLDFELPPLALLGEPEPFPYEEHDHKLREMAVLLEKTFKDFELNVKVVGINTGPVITQYEIALETGLRVNKVTALADDLAINLKVPSVRVVAPIPGKNTVGIEVPNEHRAVVRLKEVIVTAGKKIAKAKIPLFLGKDTEGRPLVYDLAEMPHLLIAGRTGTGKSVCMNAIILSMLMTRRPDEVKMIMIDPKMLEMSEYGKIPHLMHPVVKDMKKAEAILAWAVDKMEERYDLLSRARVRNIAGYNDLGKEEILRRVQPDDDEAARLPETMPYIVIFVDEMNDLMMTMKREVEGHIIRLAQKSRAAGIHLVVATQKPTVDVITGLIKSNLPARICFQVSSRTDSRVVLDEMGADKLLGKGDMLFLQPGTSTLMRAQGTYASDEEITRVVEHLECDPCYAQELIQLKTGSDAGGMMDKLKARDEMYEPAIEIVIREGRGSVSLLQRSLGIGYGRAARLIDFMAEDGIVGAYNGSNAREVLFTPEQWDEMKQTGGNAVRT
jgi:S-DNA-T family DNA segregation ATPase FtsK/SpoIIIE